MGILGKIFGASDVVKAGFDLIDNIHTSDEEEIKAKTQGKVDLLGAYAPFKLAQRVIAFMFTGVFLLCFVISLGCTIAGIGDPAAIQDLVSEWWIGEIMIAITGFYFGGGFLESRNTKAK